MEQSSSHKSNHFSMPSHGRIRTYLIRNIDPSSFEVVWKKSWRNSRRRRSRDSIVPSSFTKKYPGTIPGDGLFLRRSSIRISNVSINLPVGSTSATMKGTRTVAAYVLPDNYYKKWRRAAGVFSMDTLSFRVNPNSRSSKFFKGSFPSSRVATSTNFDG